MAENKPSDQEIGYMKTILDLIKKRRRMYKGAEIFTAITFKEKEAKLLCGRILLIDNESCEEQISQYPGVNLQKSFIDIKQTTKLIQSLVKKRTFIALEDQEIYIGGRLSYTHDYDSFDAPMRIGWPTSLCQYEIDSNYRGEEPHHLVATEFPYYPSFSSALRDWLGVSSIGGADNYRYKIPILLPNYTAKIEKWKMKVGEVDVHIDNKHSKFQNLLLKCYITTETGDIHHNDIELESSKAVFKVPTDMHYLDVVLVHKKDGKRLDWRDYNSQGWRRTDIEIDIPMEDLDYIVSCGEGPTTEFKVEINDTTKQKIAETTVAFANAHGGRIFVGVTDNLKKVGIRDEKPEDRIDQILRRKCTPSLSARYKRIPLEEGKYVLVINVDEGSNKPYLVEDKGFLIRAGSSNRLMDRHELDEIYRGKKEDIYYPHRLV